MSLVFQKPGFSEAEKPGFFLQSDPLPARLDKTFQPFAIVPSILYG